MKQRFCLFFVLCMLCLAALAQSSMISVSRDARLNRTAQLGGKAGVLFHSKSPDLVISTTVNSDPKVTMPKALGNNVYEYEMLLDVSGAADRVFKVSKKGSVISTKTGQVLLKANAYVGFNVDIVEKPIYMELSDEGGHYILHGNGWALIEINSEIKITPNYNSKLKLEHRSSRSVAGVYVDSLIINVEYLQNLHARLETVRTELDKLNAEYDALLARNTSEGALNRLDKKIREVETTVSSLSKELDELSYISIKGEGTNERVIDAEEILALKSKEKRKYNVILQSKPQDGGATARPSMTSQYVLFKVTPSNAMVELDGQMLEVVDGTITKRMPFGTYSYKVQAPRHAVKSGTIVVNDPKNKHIVNISLEPQYVNAKFSVANNAEIWIDEQKRGTGTCTLELGFGIYMVECRLPGHKPSQQEIQIDRNSATGTITLTPPIPVYGSVDINSIPAEAEIWIDGKQVGTTPMFLSECLVGRHEILLKKSGYKDKKLNLLVSEVQTASVEETFEKGFSSDGRTFTVNGVSFEMVFVEGGTFRMGSNSRGCDEDPVHDVTLSSYYIGKTEVTQALWKAVMGRNPSEFIGDSLPVENVDWNDCQEFINRINVIAGTKFRLPTEAEWEYAARGGKYSKGYRYSGSNCIDSVAWYYNNSASKTHHVGSKQPNELGIHDMTGNVWEWCSDWYGLYSRDAQTNPSGARIGIKRVRRGGKCTSGEAFCSSTYRHTYTPDLMTSNTGLRLALSNESIDVSDDNYSRNLGSGKFKVHRVKKGESLASIARKYATTVRKLCFLNSISVKTALREGQILRIP